MAVNLSPIGGVAAQFFNNNGVILSGGKIFTYSAGTTTNQATYTSAAGTIAHTNPIILDSAGRVPSGEIWLTDSLQYKFVIKDSADVLIGTYDNIIGINSNFLNYTVQEEIQTATAGQTVFTLSTVNYTPGTNTLSVFVDGVNQIDGASYSYIETNSTTVTFTTGLHVGALVKFTTAVTLSAGATTAALVSYTPNTVITANNVQAALDEVAGLLNVQQKKNYNWMGFFATWQNGHAFKTETAERVIGSSGPTFARLSFIDDEVTMYHVKGTYQADAIRIQRNNTNINTQSATMVMNLTQTETLPLLGNDICVQLHALKSSTWTGTNLTVRVQYSKEPQQPIVLANGEYTNGHTVLVQDNFALTTAMPAEDAPYSVTATLPSDAVQVAIVVTVPWAGSAGADDYVDIEGCLLTIGTTPAAAIPETFNDLIVKAKTRYQTTYPYSAPRGVTSKAGSLRATAINTSTTSAVIESVRFDPPMAIVPQVLMQSPLSGTENRWENETTGVFVNGLPYNLSDQGVTFQNNGAVTAGDVLLCHWTARCVF
jgi:hypothetical protein